MTPGDHDLDADGNRKKGPPPVSDAERRRRGAIIFLDHHRARIENILTMRLRVWGEETVSIAIGLTEEELLVTEGFPLDGDEVALPKFLERVAERVAKREQRRLLEERGGHVDADDAVLASPAMEHAEYDQDEVERLRKLPGFALVYQHHVLKRSVADIAKERNEKADAVYKAISRTKAQMVRAGVATVAFAMFASLFFYMRWQADPLAHHPTVVSDAGVAYDRAMAAFRDGEKACNLGQWGECLELLDKAEKADPTIREREGFQTLRAAAEAALPRPNPLPAPTAESPTDPGKARGSDAGRGGGK